jgi:hypothetical protein
MKFFLIKFSESKHPNSTRFYAIGTSDRKLMHTDNAKLALSAKKMLTGRFKAPPCTYGRTNLTVLLPDVRTYGRPDNYTPCEPLQLYSVVPGLSGLLNSSCLSCLLSFWAAEKQSPENTTKKRTPVRRTRISMITVY